MNAFALMEDEKQIEYLKELMLKNEIGIKFSRDLMSFKSDSLKYRPDIFFIEINKDSSLELIHLINDIKTIFGVIATIIVIGSKANKKSIGNILINGADHFFLYPLDGALVEDFLSKRTTSEHCQGFRYRNIPSRSHPIKVDFSVNLIEVNTRGIIIESNHLYKIGSVSEIPGSVLSEKIQESIRLITTSFELGEICRYKMNLNYYEIKNDLKSKIINYIRNN